MITADPDIEACYSEYPHIYAAFADDRNFREEANALISVASPNRGGGGRFLDLFAGPAYHSIAVEAFAGWEAVAIDSSEAMKRVALQRGFADGSRYVVGPLPTELQNLNRTEPFDCAFAGRFSLGYLDLDGVHILLRDLMPLLKAGGLCVIELHELDILLASLTSLDIRDRVATGNEGEEIRCTWPNGPIRWHRDDYVAEMPVSIEVQNRAGQVQRLSFLSTEHVHAPGLVRWLGGQLGYSVQAAIDLPERLAECFTNSSIVVLKKSH
jgi:hypothetical protein